MVSKLYTLVPAIVLMPLLSTAQGLVINEGANMFANDATVILNRNVVNNGSFIHNNNTVILTGKDQSFNGDSTSTFNNVTVQEGADAAVNSGLVQVKGILLTNGTLNANGNLTLVATDTQTALIDGNGLGEILGKVNMQKHINSAFGYTYLGSPFKDAAVSELADDINLGAQTPELYRYDETDPSTGWIAYTNRNAQLIPLQGYAAMFNTPGIAKNVSIAGTVNNGEQSITLYNNNKAFTQGFNLISNPYPSPINWSLVDLTGSNIDDAVYYFDGSTTDKQTGTYSSYVNGISTNGVAGIRIPAMSGFFVHVSDGQYPTGGTLNLNNNVRINHFSPDTAKEEIRPMIRLSTNLVNQSPASDPIVIYMDEVATTGFDKKCDALKLMNTDVLTPSVYTVAGDKKLSINALPYGTDSTRIIPIGIKTEHEGLVNFKALVDRLPYGMRPYFTDTKTGFLEDIAVASNYSVSLTAGVYEHRFFLVLSNKDPKLDPLFGDPFNAYGNKGKLYVDLNLKSGGEGNFFVTNMAGQVIMKQDVEGFGVHEYEAGWNSGIYVVSFVSPEGTFSKKVVMTN